MSYFSKFGSIRYDIRQDKNYTLVKNILTRFILREEAKSSGDVFLNYIVRDGDRPDTIAYKLYNRADYHWLVLIANHIINPYWDFPVSSYSLEKYIQKLYPGTAMFFNPTEYINAGNEALLPSETRFLKGRRVYGETSEATAIITKVTPEYSSIVIEDIEGTFLLNENIRSFSDNGKIVRAPVRKIVQEEQFSLHHFETPTGNVVDPLSRTYTNTTTLPDIIDFPQTNLGAYILDGINTNVITNRDYEIKANDAKRSIKLIQSKFIDVIIQDFEDMITVR